MNHRECDIGKGTVRKFKNLVSATGIEDKNDFCCTERKLQNPDYCNRIRNESIKTCPGVQSDRRRKDLFSELTKY